MTIKCPAFELPDSSLISDTSRDILIAYRARIKTIIEQAARQEPTSVSQSTPTEEPVEARETERKNYYSSEPYQHLVGRYSVDIETSSMGGVVIETFTPRAGVAAHNKSRVLMNIHGGGFASGSRTMSRMESIPVAALGKIKVVSVDYRMAPEHRYPAATDDAFAVYCTLLDAYSPNTIGIFGSSAGAYITAQLMVRLQEQAVELPKAIARIAGGAYRKTGDSMAMGGAIVKGLHGADLSAFKDEYFIGADRTSPQVTPGLSDRYMAAFPPAFLASSTRDYLLSAVVATHRKLIGLGVEAELQLWEGLDHVFHCNCPDLPESEELHQLTVDFFNKQLGSQ